MSLRSTARVGLLAGLLVLAAVWPVSAADREKLLTEPGVYGTFATFQMDHDWWDLPGESRVISVAEVKGLVEQWSGKILVESYLLRGLSDHADLMFRVHARTLSDTQQFLSAFMGTRLGRHLTSGGLLHGVSKKPTYVAGFPESMKTELQVNGESGSRPYAIVIPIKKDAEWWGLDQEARTALMQEHTQAALPYLKTVKRKLYHSTGLDDVDFITYFETERLEDFHNLVRALQQVKEFRHNRRFGHPTLLGTMSPLDEILEKFAQ